jgi:hypothetical protein
VHKLNPHHLEILERRFAEPEPGSIAAAGEQQSQWQRPASIVELRAGFENGRELREIFRQAINEAVAQRRQSVATEHVERMELAEGRAELRQTLGGIAHGFDRATDQLQKGTHAVAGFLNDIAKGVGKVLDAIGDILAPAPPPTKDQAERMERAADELATDIATAVNAEQKQAATDAARAAAAARPATRLRPLHRPRTRRRRRPQGRIRPRPGTGARTRLASPSGTRRGGAGTGRRPAARSPVYSAPPVRLCSTTRRSRTRRRSALATNKAQPNSHGRA